MENAASHNLEDEAISRHSKEDSQIPSNKSNNDSQVPLKKKKTSEPTKPKTKEPTRPKTSPALEYVRNLRNSVQQDTDKQAGRQAQYLELKVENVTFVKLLQWTGVDKLHLDWLKKEFYHDLTCK